MTDSRTATPTQCTDSSSSPAIRPTWSHTTWTKSSMSYALLAAIAHGTTNIHGYSTGGDCAATLRCLRALGVAIDDSRRDPVTGPEIRIEGRGLGGFMPAAGTLDAGNSGSTMRMLAGILAAHPFLATLDGDASLRARPMRRVMTPLAQMGARMLS